MRNAEMNNACLNKEKLNDAMDLRRQHAKLMHSLQ